MRTLLVCGLLSSACATTKAAAPADEPAAKKEEAAATPAPAPAPAPVEKKPTPEEMARQIEAMFARELEASPGTQSVTLEGKTIEIESAAPVEVTRTDALKQSQLNLSLGTAEKVQCFVYDTLVPVGALLGQLTEGLRGKVEIKSLRTTAIDVIEKEPAVFSDIAYVAVTPNGNVIGQLKLAVYPNAAAPLACLHDEPGYVETFHRLVTKLAAGLAKARAPAETLSYRAVYVTSIRGSPVGFERSSYLKAKDGSRVATTMSAMIVPRSPTEWMLHDSVYVSQIAKDGYLTQKTARMTANGEEQLDITVKRDKGGYSYSGRVSQKELSGKFKTKDKKGLASDVVVTREVKGQLMPGKKAHLQFEQYMPDADPTAPLLVTVKKDAAAPDAITLETAKLKLYGRVDAWGDLVTVEVPMGPVTLLQERKFVEGSPE